MVAWPASVSSSVCPLRSLPAWLQAGTLMLYNSRWGVLPLCVPGLAQPDAHFGALRGGTPRRLACLQRVTRES